MSLAEELGHEDVAASLALLRRTTERWLLQERSRGRVSSGIAALDALLAGGWPQGRIGELVGPPSSGRSGIAAATVAAATERGEVVAWIDVAGAFAPASARAAGIDLERMLWIRPAGVADGIRAAELVLETGGFPLVVLDLVGSTSGATGRRPGAKQSGRGGEKRGALRLRIARAVERAGAVVLIVAERPWAGTMAGVTVALERGVPRWGGKNRHAPRWLAGLSTSAWLERGAASPGDRCAELHFTRQTRPVSRDRRSFDVLPNSQVEGRDEPRIPNPEFRAKVGGHPVLRVGDGRELWRSALRSGGRGA